MLVTYYWSILILLFGGIIGSFLNVVIYRWPRDLSIRKPSRSFCPFCNTGIAWYDNIPAISYLILGGKCRHCRVSISLQYPLVELATALVFLMTYDAFFVARLRIGVSDLAVDWPIFIAHLALGAGLIALAVMDLEAYLVDIRVTWAILLVGIIGHTLWTPASSSGWIRPGPDQAVLAIVAAVGLAIGGWIFLRRPPEPLADDELPAEEELSDDPPVSQTSSVIRIIVACIPLVLVVAYFAAMVINGQRPDTAASQTGAIRLGVGLAITFVALALVASHPHAEADNDIVEAIESEAPAARRMALGELKLLSPAILLGAAMMTLLITRPDIRVVMANWLHLEAFGQWQPLWGFCTAISGWIIGGAIGWLARIGFTLLFGKEALGMGDVHILAAAGAVAGWPVAFFGFFLAAPLTLLALVVIHFRRQSRALPYGPWLGLAFFAASLFQDHILLYLGFRWVLESS